MVIDSIRDFVLPNEVIALAEVVDTFQAAKRSEKPQTEWYRLCVSCQAFVNFNRREIKGFRIDAVEFSACAARAYSDLLNLKNLPYFNSDAVKKASLHADKLIEISSNTVLLSDSVKNTQLLNLLYALSNLDIKAAPPNIVTAKGNPVVRLLIYNLSEEFCFSFAKAPSVLIIWGLMQIGWPKIDIKTVRYAANENLFSFALEQSILRRQNQNKSLVIDQQSKNAEISAKNIIKSVSPPAYRKPGIVNFDSNVNLENGDEAIFKSIIKLAKGLENRNASFRLTSFVNSMLESECNPQDDN